jgi:hypothetical protein
MKLKVSGCEEYVYSIAEPSFLKKINRQIAMFALLVAV